MRVMLTGEVVDSGQAPTQERESFKKEQQLEDTILSNYELGNYKRAAGLLDEFVFRWRLKEPLRKRRSLLRFR